MASQGGGGGGYSEIESYELVVGARSPPLATKRSFGQMIEMLRMRGDTDDRDAVDLIFLKFRKGEGES